MESQEPAGLAVIVREAAFLQPFREQHLQRPGVTIPPHVTVCSPFLAADAITSTVRDRLREMCARFQGFTFTLDRLGRFDDPGVLYLVPEPTQGFIRLSEAVQLAFAFEPRRRPIFHMTLAGWHPTDLNSIARAFDLRYGGQLPIPARATTLSLYRRQGQVWIKGSDYPLAPVA